MLLLDGTIVRDQVAGTLSRLISERKDKPRLVIIQVGDLEESNRYIFQKKKFGQKIGAEVEHRKLPENIEQEKLIAEINKQSADPKVHGIIVQFPLPARLDPQKVVDAINPSKDVDGMTAANLKLLWENRGGFIPATTKGIFTLLEHYKIPVASKKVVIVGRSTLVGKPTALVMTNRNATVTLCHSKTADLQKETAQAEILIVAAGSPKLIGAKHVKKGQVVIDVGINLITGEKFDEEIPKKKLVGDVDFDAVKAKVKALSPVPGGVGPLTVASLFQNLFDSFSR